MKTIRRTIMTLAALAGLAGCAKENADSPEKNPTGNTLVTLTANQENAETKAEISTTDSKVINWTKDDAITVIDGDGKNVEFTLTEGEGTSSGKFKGEVSKTADSYIALYPYQKDVTASEGALNGVVLKSEQTAVAGSFDPEAALMMAESEAGSLSFKNIVGFVKVTPTVSCARITLVSNNSESNLAGTADITMTDGKPTATVTDGASSSVSIVGNIEAGKPYYIAIFPETLAGGFRLVFTTSDGQDTYKSTTKQLEIKRNYVTNLGNVEGAIDEYPYVTFTAASEQTFKISRISSLECSVGGAAWQSVKADTEVKFGGSKGSLRLRGKSERGTYYNGGSSTISFTDQNVEVSCKGDIRTLIDWENYKNANTENARFSRLFYYCPVLTSAPDLPSEKLSANCYTSMFEGCSKLTSAPALPAKELAEECYTSMFSGCSALTKAPDLPAENVPTSAYNYMFNKCSSLEEMPLISAKTVEKLGMAGMFAECSNLSIIKDLCVETFTGGYNCMVMFNNCTNLINAPALPATEVAERCYYQMFMGCTSLEKGPSISAGKVGPYCCSQMFDSCIKMESGPEILPAEELSEYCYHNMFRNCKSLSKAPILPADILASNCYEYMFNGCNSLSSAPDLPAKNLEESCYASMFTNCKSITKAGISAENVAELCFYNMFNGCSNLNEVTLYVKDFDKNQYANVPNPYLPEMVFYPFEGWLNGTAGIGTVYIRKGLSDATREAIYLPNENWTFVEDVTD